MIVSTDADSGKSFLFAKTFCFSLRKMNLHTNKKKAQVVPTMEFPATEASQPARAAPFERSQIAQHPQNRQQKRLRLHPFFFV